ncbi:MAG TPA: hypothetical protein VNF07_10405 [Acidimicrobiales bacterium]|nr:hypothetical protein [Acidimicrobiales bacterium]
MSERFEHVAVVFGGPSPEHDVSVLTALLAARTLRTSPVVGELTLVYWSKNGSFFDVPGEPEARDFTEGAPKGSEQVELALGPGGGFARRSRRGPRPLAIDAALVCCHGGPGEDGALQGALDLAGVAYTGPTALSAALGMDKLAAGAVVRGAGLPSLDRVLLDERAAPPEFAGPYIVKPRFGGSSIGIEVIADHPTALARRRASVHLRRGAVLEPYRADLFDLQVAVLTYPELLLSDIERPTREGGEILDYRAKYVAGEGMHEAARELPAQISEALATQLREAAATAALLLGARGVARIDFLSDGEVLYLNEINTIPGSLSRHLFINPPLAFSELLERMLEEARERPAAQFSAAGADGTVLADAQSIAKKLG